MKLFLFLLFVPFSMRAQRLVLLDRSLIEPTKLATDIGLEQLAKGSFPIYYEDVSPLLEVAGQFLKDMSHGRTGKFAFREIKVGKTVFFTHMANKGVYYKIVLRTNCDNMVSSIVIADEGNRKKALQRLSIFVDYLKNNFAALK